MTSDSTLVGENCFKFGHDEIYIGLPIVCPLLKYEFNDTLSCIFINELSMESDLSGKIQGYIIDTKNGITLSSYTFDKSHKESHFQLDGTILVAEDFFLDVNETECINYYNRVKITDEGYFYEYEVHDISKPDSKYFRVRFQDPDGYSHVRERPNVKSPILYTVEADNKISIVETIPNSNWYKVLYYVPEEYTAVNLPHEKWGVLTVYKNILSLERRGCIHKSRTIRLPD